MKISYNKDAAKRGAVASGGNIVSGVHLGKFTLAELVVSSKKQTKGIEFTFQTPDEATARYLTIWVESKDGKELGYGQDQLQAIMTVLGVRDIEAVPTIAKKWNNGSLQDVTVDAFPQLAGIPLKILFQEVLYTKGNGSDGSKGQMVQWFNAETGCNAIERLDGLAQGVEIVSVTENPLPPVDERRSAGSSSSELDFGSDTGAPVAASSGGKADFDDDIPF